MFFPFKEDRIQHMEKKKYLRILPALLISLTLLQPQAVHAYAETPDPSLYEGLGSDYIYVYDIESGQVLTELNPDERMYPASMTKMLTVIVALERRYLVSTYKFIYISAIGKVNYNTIDFR